MTQIECSSVDDFVERITNPNNHKYDETIGVYFMLSNVDNSMMFFDMLAKFREKC